MGYLLTRGAWYFKSIDDHTYSDFFVKAFNPDCSKGYLIKGTGYIKNAHNFKTLISARFALMHMIPVYICDIIKDE